MIDVIGEPPQTSTFDSSRSEAHVELHSTRAKPNIFVKFEFLIDFSFTFEYFFVFKSKQF